MLWLLNSEPNRFLKSFKTKIVIRNIINIEIIGRRNLQTAGLAVSTDTMNMNIEDNINTIVVAAARMVIRLKLEVAEIKKLKPRRSTNIT